MTVGILAGMIAALGLYVFLVGPLWALPALERITPNLVYRVRTKEPLVGLSFDDGPHAKFTPQVLDILEQCGAKATFFLIGERALREQDLVARIRAEGHEIGNHYFENGPTLLHSDATFAKKLEETERAIGLEAPGSSDEGRPGKNKASEEEKTGHPRKDDRRQAAGHPPATGDKQKDDPADESSHRGGTVKTVEDGATPLFRPPGGVAWPWQLRLAKSRRYTCVLGCAYPHDPARPPIAYMRWLIQKNLRPGTIVILHDGIADARKSIEVLPQILEEGRKRGLKFVAIGELMRAERPS